MIYVSPSPFEIGAFDVVEANKVATEIYRGDFEIERTEASGRLVIPKNNIEAIDEIMGRISIYNSTDEDSSVIRNRVYAQDFTEIDEERFIGLPWHIDAKGKVVENKQAFHFNFGCSSHPTEYLDGMVDLSEAAEMISMIFEDPNPSPAKVVLFASGLVKKAIDESKAKGDLTVETMDEGVLYRIPAGTIHRMQPFDSNRKYPPRFCVEQYLKQPEDI